MSEFPLKEWCVVILKEIQPDGKKVWKIVSEHDDAEQAEKRKEAFEAEGFIVRLVCMVETEEPKL